MLQTLNRSCVHAAPIVVTCGGQLTLVFWVTASNADNVCCSDETATVTAITTCNGTGQMLTLQRESCNAKIAMVTSAPDNQVELGIFNRE